MYKQYLKNNMLTLKSGLTCHDGRANLMSNTLLAIKCIVYGLLILSLLLLPNPQISKQNKQA